MAINQERLEKAHREWLELSNKVARAFTIACCQLLHAEGLTVTQVKELVDSCAEQLRLQGKNIEQ